MSAVWIFAIGESYEGYCIKNIYHNKEDAIAAAEEYTKLHLKTWNKTILSELCIIWKKDESFLTVEKWIVK